MKVRNRQHIGNAERLGVVVQAERAPIVVGHRTAQVVRRIEHEEGVLQAADFLVGAVDLDGVAEQAQQVHAVLRAQIKAATPHHERVAILYGGSMNAANAASLLAQPDIDGGLIGGAEAARLGHRGEGVEIGEVGLLQVNGEPVDVFPVNSGVKDSTGTVLQKRDLADALAVTIGLFDGSLTAIPGTDRGFPDWSSVPRHVSRLCAEMHPVEPGWKQEVKRKQTGQGIIKDDPQMAAAYADALEILEGGGTMTDVRAMLLLRFPDSGAAVREPYREDEYQEI